MLTKFDMNLLRISRNVLRDILRLAVKDYNSSLFFFNGGKLSGIPLIKSGSLPSPLSVGGPLTVSPSTVTM